MTAQVIVVLPQGSAGGVEPVRKSVQRNSTERAKGAKEVCSPRGGPKAAKPRSEMGPNATAS